MATTRTPGITIDAVGNRTIDKEHLRVRIFIRLGSVGQQEAEQRLRVEIERVQCELQRQAQARPRFAQCAVRYLAESRDKRSIDAIRLHVRLLLPHVGDLEAWQVHDTTLEPFISDRLRTGVSASTINRSLEVVCTILNRAARSYRDGNGHPWLESVPPQITMLPESPRPPYPITWEEQDELLLRLPARLARMVLFALNTGLRESNVCGLEWAWEVPVPQVGRSVFVIPPEAFKTRRGHVVILNDAAWSIVQAQRGIDPIWVFPFRGRRVGKMNNNAWQHAREETGLRKVRIQDLRHTCGARLRAAGVSQEDREVLLGHANHCMAGHYASADVSHLIRQANLILDRREMCTVLRVANGSAAGLPVDDRSRTSPAARKLATLIMEAGNTSTPIPTI